MRLETYNSFPLDHPDEQAVADALGRLGRGQTSWVALSADARRSSLLCAARGRKGYILEFADDRVWRCRAELPLDDVLRLFRCYHGGNTTWRGGLAWKDVTNESGWVYWVLVGVVVVAVGLASLKIAALLAALRMEL